jgi:hypothetical protein
LLRSSLNKIYQIRNYLSKKTNLLTCKNFILISYSIGRIYYMSREIQQNESFSNNIRFLKVFLVIVHYLIVDKVQKIVLTKKDAKTFFEKNSDYHILRIIEKTNFALILYHLPTKFKNLVSSLSLNNISIDINNLLERSMLSDGERYKFPSSDQVNDGRDKHIQSTLIDLLREIEKLEKNIFGMVEMTKTNHSLDNIIVVNLFTLFENIFNIVSFIYYFVCLEETSLKKNFEALSDYKLPELYVDGKHNPYVYFISIYHNKKALYNCHIRRLVTTMETLAVFFEDIKINSICYPKGLKYTDSIYPDYLQHKEGNQYLDLVSFADVLERAIKALADFVGISRNEKYVQEAQVLKSLRQDLCTENVEEQVSSRFKDILHQNSLESKYLLFNLTIIISLSGFDGLLTLFDFCEIPDFEYFKERIIYLLLNKNNSHILDNIKSLQKDKANLELSFIKQNISSTVKYFEDFDQTLILSQYPELKDMNTLDRIIFILNLSEVFYDGLSFTNFVSNPNFFASPEFALIFTIIELGSIHLLVSLEVSSTKAQRLVLTYQGITLFELLNQYVENQLKIGEDIISSQHQQPNQISLLQNFINHKTLSYNGKVMLFDDRSLLMRKKIGQALELLSLLQDIYENINDKYMTVAKAIYLIETTPQISRFKTILGIHPVNRCKYISLCINNGARIIVQIPTQENNFKFLIFDAGYSSYIHDKFYLN